MLLERYAHTLKIRNSQRTETHTSISSTMNLTSANHCGLIYR